MRLAPETGADPRVVELFAFLHDSQRENDGWDPEHGDRAAEFAIGLNGRFFELDVADLDLLVAACRGHSHGGREGHPTVLTCWDADRLDLGRVHKRPDPARLCTAAARDAETIAWAYGRSLDWLARHGLGEA
ncbi:MAG: hypothetical protein HKP30_11740 [Myxococcales bacterium]|nr:hypothetical protein [Myxococcales bacterium]